MDDSSLKFYLSKLNDSPLLTRDQEKTLLDSVEVLQNEILSKCINSMFFKSELKDLLTSLSIDDIINISRKLNEESPKSEIDIITNQFLELVESLDRDDFKYDTLLSVALSGNIVHSLTSKIKKKYSKIEEVESKRKDLVKFFMVKDLAALRELIDKVKNDRSAFDYLKAELRLTESRLLAKCHELIDYDEAVKSLIDFGVTESNIGEIKKIYADINTAEFKMKRFKDELIEKNLRLVVSRAKLFVNRGLDFEDLVQEGNIGLIKAINKHDSSRGTKISTYATWWIDQNIRRAISNKSRTVRIPTHIEFFQSTLATTISELTQELGRFPTKEEIAKKANIDVEVLDRLEKVAMHKVGIDDEVSSGMTLLNMLPADPSENPFNIAAKNMLREKIRSILSTLSPRTEKIIRLRFGIGEPHEEMTLQEIANNVGLTKMGVKLIQNKGLKKIKQRGNLKNE